MYASCASGTGSPSLMTAKKWPRMCAACFAGSGAIGGSETGGAANVIQCTIGKAEIDQLHSCSDYLLTLNGPGNRAIFLHTKRIEDLCDSSPCRVSGENDLLKPWCFSCNDSDVSGNVGLHVI